MTLSRPLLIDLNIALLVLLFVVVGYKLSPALVPYNTTTVRSDAGCNLHVSACTATLPDGRQLKIEITPHPLPVIHPMRVSVELEGATPRSIEADLSGIGMAMGLNRVALMPVGRGRYAADASLAVCLSGPMRWQLTLLIDTGQSVAGIPFLFTIPGR